MKHLMQTLLATVGCLSALTASSHDLDFAAPGTPMAQPPQIKVGLWKHTETLDGRPLPLRTECSKGVWRTPTCVGICSAFGFRRTSDGRVIFDSECASLDQQQTSSNKWAISGDLNSSYIADGDMLILTKGAPPMHTTTHDEAVYIGPCPAVE